MVILCRNEPISWGIGSRGDSPSEQREGQQSKGHQRVVTLVHLQEPGQLRELVEGLLPVAGLLVLLLLLLELPHCCCCLLVCSRVERVCARKWEGKARMRNQVVEPMGVGGRSLAGAGPLEMWLRRGAGACVQQGRPVGCG